MHRTHLGRTCALLLAATSGLSHGQSYYQGEPLFSTAPNPAVTVNTIERFGPVGMAVELHQPAFTMVVGEVEPGSPAATAKLSHGQIIESINGESLKAIDPRIQLGQILAKAEATDGTLRFKVKDKAGAEAKEVVVQIPALGSYSKTWPINCPKSQKIIRGFADYLSNPKSGKGFADAGMLFLLSTGDDKDLGPVREWVQGLAKQKTNGYAWHIGIGGIPLCEYYLRTGDPAAMTIIQQWVQAAAKGEYLDAWAGRGGVVKLGYGNGHLNAGGTAVVTFLLLAKQCGAEVDESLLQRTLTHFFRYAGRGLNPYGDDRPETSFVDNGKNGNLAFAMAAAASLTPEGENSVYARARDIAAMSSFYTTTFMLHGHTGGGIGEIWRSSAMSLVREKKPLQYREFMDHRQWHYDLSRRFDGSFGILGGAGYDNTEWGALYPWAYTFPLKTLRITGAPPSKFSKSHPLPKRPWGTAADDAFLSLDAAADKDGKREDLSGELLTRDSAKPLILRLTADKELSDDEIRRYARHPEYLIRHMVVGHAAGLEIRYMSPKPAHRVRPALLEELARDPDPRVRNAGIRAAVQAFDPAADWSKAFFDLAIERLKDEQESWWIKDACLSLIARGTPDQIVSQVDLILTYLKHPEQWLQNGALHALTVICTDERCHEKVLPAIAELLRVTPRQSTTAGPMREIAKVMPNASPKVREAALKALGSTYLNYEGKNTWAGGQDMRGHRQQTIEAIAGALVGVPGGYDALYELSKQQQPDNPLPHQEIFLGANPEQFGPKLQAAILPIIREELIYQFIGKKRRTILSDIAKPVQKGSVTNSIDELVELYQKVGVHDYDWKPFGPDLKNSEWDYFSFEPAEKQAYDKTPWRYRTVSYPKGMENWQSPEFKPSAAGWKQGLPPFGQYRGKLADNSGKLLEGPDGKRRTDTVWKQSPRTLWEHEVLLLRTTRSFPALKPGHLYRVRVDSGQGVGAGDGFKIFINGKTLVEVTEGLGRRAGDTQRGGWISGEFTDAFAQGPVTIAATSFLRYGDRAVVTMPPVPQGIFSVWIEERKLPPLDSATMRKAASFVPMLSSEWQAQQHSGSDEGSAADSSYRYNGQFTPKPEFLGSWSVIATVNRIEDFTSGAKPAIGKVPFRKIRLEDQGHTDSNDWIWSGDTLMDLTNSQALKMVAKPVDGSPHLFIEAGGFSPKNPAGWKCQWMVLKRD